MEVNDMKDISNLEKKYYPRKNMVDRLVLENFIRSNMHFEIGPGHISTTTIVNTLGRNGICSLKELYEADVGTITNAHLVGAKMSEIIFQLKKRISEELLEEEP